MKPLNVISILIDDMGWKDLSCYGSSFYETPVIDRLAREGMRFSNAYASCPVCSPSRASLLTGKYPARVGVTDWIGGDTRGKLISADYLHHLPEGEYTLAHAFKAQGYHTWHVGKWHLGGKEYFPEKFGFDVNIGGNAWGLPIYGYFSPYHIETLPEGPEGEFLTDRITDEAIRLLENADDKPFYMNLCHYAVHIPIQAPEHLIEKYRQKAKRMGLPMEEALEEGEHFPCEHKKDEYVIRRRVQSDPAYAALIENLDTNIGRLIDALERLGRLDDTLILFTSDNGGLSTTESSPTCNAPLSEGKGWMYEGGVREPLIVWRPGMIPAGETDVVVTTPDIYPTLLELAGFAPIPQQHVDGMSFAPALRGEKHDRGAIYWHYPHYGNQGGTPGSSVLEDGWKLIHFWEEDVDELYYLPEDISEVNDIAAAHPDKVKALREKLMVWLDEVGAAIPQPNPDYQPWEKRGDGRHYEDIATAPWQ